MSEGGVEGQEERWWSAIATPALEEYGKSGGMKKGEAFMSKRKESDMKFHCNQP